MVSSEKRTFLIIRLSSMGDIILTTHLLRCLRNSYPNAIIDFLTLDKFKEILSNQPYTDAVISYNKEEGRKSNVNFILNKSSIIEGKYDHIIDLQNNLRTRLIRSKLGKNIISYDKNRSKKLFMVFTGNREKYEIESIPLVYLSSLKELQVEDDGKGLEIWLNKDKNAGEYLPYSREVFNKKILSLAPGAYHNTKKFPIEKYLEIIRSIKPVKLNLIGGQQDKELCNYLEQNLSGIDVQNHAGKRSILETAEIIDDSGFVISNDTGVMHIASARKVPQIAIFGSTVPELGFSPFRGTAEIIENNDLKCRPCTHIGRDKCPKGHFDCMQKIDQERIINVYRKFGV